jgi:organic radical activating enzyme
MLKEPIKIIQKTPLLRMYWLLTDFCNFKCNYCPEKLHSGNYASGKHSGFPTDEQITIFVDKLKNKEITEKSLHLTLAGGEPTTHHMFPYIVNSLRKINNYITVITNGSRSLSWWEKVLPLDSVTISLHHEFTDIKKINELSRLIISSGTGIRFHLSADPNNWDNVLNLYNNLDDDLKAAAFPKVLNELDTQQRHNFFYTEDQKLWIAAEAARNKNLNLIRPTDKFSDSNIHFSDGTTSNFFLSSITLNNWHKFKGWNCSIASQGIIIGFDGNVYAGLCRSQTLGTIDNFKLGNDIICPFEFCPCPVDMLSDKFKI